MNVGRIIPPQRDDKRVNLLKFFQVSSVVNSMYIPGISCLLFSYDAAETISMSFFSFLDTFMHRFVFRQLLFEKSPN